MKAPIVIIGIGEMAGVFARGFLRAGHPVFPIVRGMDMEAEAATLPDPALVLLAVAEKDLHATLEAVPRPWRDRLALLQNELLPRDWQRHGLDDPTVISVWFEKKPGMDFKVIIPSPVHGPRASVLADGLSAIGIGHRILDSANELLHELVVKNLYILTSNICGLVVGGTVGGLWNQHRAMAEQVAHDVIDIQEWLTGETFDRQRLMDGMLAAFDGDPDHKCMGRSAPARLQRALELAGEAGLAVPQLNRIHAQTQVMA